MARMAQGLKPLKKICEVIEMLEQALADVGDVGVFDGNQCPIDDIVACDKDWDPEPRIEDVDRVMLDFSTREPDA